MSKRSDVAASRLEFGGNGQAGRVVFTDTRVGFELAEDAITWRLQVDLELVKNWLRVDWEMTIARVFTLKK